jgi:xylulokinase
MSCQIGIDLGTSSVKVVVVSPDARLLGVGNAEYPIHTPSIGFAEQDPTDWWHASVRAAREALEKSGRPEISGIGFSGQMHGFVFINAERLPIHPAIIWADQRSADLLPELEALLGADMARCGTAPAAGFLVSTLYWIQRHQPDLLERAYTFLMPKDYVRLMLTGELGTDPSDASATGLFDIRRRVWADEPIARLKLPGSIFPQITNSSEVVGRLTQTAAALLGIAAGIPIVTGSADQPAQAVGNGLIDPPRGSVTVGTGGQVFLPLTEPVVDPKLRLHTFCHAPSDRWYLLGAMLSAGMALRWLRSILGNDRFSYADLDKLAQEVEPGSEGLTFLPYIVGERSPIMDSRAKGSFVGLTLRHGPGHMVRALLEGVAFALRQIVECMESCGASMPELVASGNGLGSPLWRQILADILARPLYQGKDENSAERAGVGSALIAGIGAGIYRGYEETRNIAPVFNAVTKPDAEYAGRYGASYARFCDLYPRLKSWF